MPPKKRSTGTPLNKEIKQNNKVVSPAKEENSELSIDRHKDKDAEFVTLSEKLKVTDAVCDRAWAVWDSVRASVDIIQDTNPKHWGACLFIAATDLEVTTFSFTEVLKAHPISGQQSVLHMVCACPAPHPAVPKAQTYEEERIMMSQDMQVFSSLTCTYTERLLLSINSVKQFFNLLKMMDTNMDTISTKVNAAMTRLEKKFQVTRALFQRFEKEKDVADSKQIIRGCWTLFLLAKGRVLQMEDDLVISFQLLMCVLEFYIRRSPPALLQQPYSKPRPKALMPLPHCCNSPTMSPAPKRHRQTLTGLLLPLSVLRTKNRSQLTGTVRSVNPEQRSGPRAWSWTAMGSTALSAAVQPLKQVLQLRKTQG
ncbi:hypothetical protein JZ751_013934 [Albula glossodonta]|uniref:Retinoblastoma-associated protein N-terminal domain-containing protein n=1 Tax=Albula glossodonta TaxID=121402 RepID=A0A8T2MXB1_9TELE|nr:hypothetical protein JZ751_013934 [Albula glossodonta]